MFVKKLTVIKVSLISLFLLLSGCGDNDEIKIDVDNPELVAIDFFNAIYNEKNIRKAAAVCSPKLSRIILHYRSPNAVARHVFNMSYDSMDVKAEDNGIKIREQFKDEAIITLYFDGEYQGERFKDVKRVALVQIDGNWVLDKLLKDPF